jgi:TPR repeat protein
MSVVRIAAFVLGCFAVAAVASEAVPPDPRDVIKSTVPGCATGLERLLPGQYYFCAAVRDYGQRRDRLALERLRDAAYWASKPAQYVLGLTYYNGDRGHANRPLGIAWLALAAERHEPRFESAFSRAYLASSPEERAQADVYWRDLRKQYADAVAGRRAHRRYLAEIRMIEAATAVGGSVFIAGLTPPNGDSMGQFGADGEANRTPGGSGFSMNQLLTHAGDDFFRGMAGTVTVGEVQGELVPIGQVASRVAPR